MGICICFIIYTSRILDMLGSCKFHNTPQSLNHLNQVVGNAWRGSDRPQV